MLYRNVVLLMPILEGHPKVIKQIIMTRYLLIKGAVSFFYCCA
jgi:hypothetical protein